MSVNSESTENQHIGIDMARERRRRRAARAADANLRIEGLEMSGEAQALRERWIEGDITADELIDRTKTLVQAKYHG